MAADGGIDSSDHGILSSLMLNFDHLDIYVQNHLLNVYGCLSLGVLSAVCGIYIHLISHMGEWYFMSTVTSVVCAVWVLFTHHTKENFTHRMGAFSGFTFFSGVSTGPLLELVVKVDPSIVPTSVFSSIIICSSLSLAALSDSDRKLASMTVILFSLFFLLMFVEVINTYLASRLIFDVYIYCSLALFACFVVHDTQTVVEKRIRGGEDFIWHSLVIFVDVFQMFKLMMIILAKKESSKTRRED